MKPRGARVMAEALESRRMLTFDATALSVISPINDNMGDSPVAPVALGNRIIFGNSDPKHGYQLWVSDGTPAGTHLFTNEKIFAKTPAQDVVAGDGVVFFVEPDANGVLQVWRSDGTRGGTFAVSKFVDPEINEPYSKDDPAVWPANVPQALYYDSQTRALYFQESTTTFNSLDLWVTGPDGRFEAKHLGVDLTATDFVTAGSTLYFIGSNVLNQSQLWTTDGTKAGTRTLSSFDTGSYSDQVRKLGVLGDTVIVDLVLAVPNGPISVTDEGDELYETTGDAPVTAIPGGEIENSLNAAGVDQMVAFGSVLYFNAEDSTGDQIWRYDPSAAQQVEKVAISGVALATDVGGNQLTEYKGSLYFFETGPNPETMCRLTSEDTAAAVDVPFPTDFPYFENAYVIGGQMYVTMEAIESNGDYPGEFSGFQTQVYVLDGSHFQLVNGNPVTPSEGTTQVEYVTDVGGQPYYLYVYSGNFVGGHLYDVVDVDIGPDLTLTAGTTQKFSVHVSSGTIAKVQWDLNGNGKFDSHSLHPTWTYSTPTAKPITVRARVTLTDGVVLNAAVTVTVTA